MSTSRKLLSIMLVLAGVVGLLRWGSGQVDGGGPIGALLIHDFDDLDAFASFLRSPDIQAHVGPALLSGDSVADLSFVCFSKSLQGDRVYLSTLALTSSTWHSVHYVPANGANPTTYARGPFPGMSNVRPVVGSHTGFQFLVHAIGQPPPTIRQAYITKLSDAKLTGLRVKESPFGSRSTHYQVELFFDGDQQAPKLTVGADFDGSTFAGFAIE